MTGQEKKEGVVCRYVNVVLELVHSEWVLLHERVLYPEYFAQKEKRQQVEVRWKSKQYKMKIVELVVGLILVDELCSAQGTMLSEAALVAMIEEVFGVSLENFSQLKDQLFRRKNGHTPFLKQMVRAIELYADEKYRLPSKKK